MPGDPDEHEIDAKRALDALTDKAREMYQADGEIEIDDDPEISEGDDGTWVQAWVWVPNK